jgi:hypothetical protein
MKTIGSMFEGGDQIRKLLMETVIQQGEMDRSALVFGMMSLIVDLKPADISQRQWGEMVAGVFGHFARQADNQEPLQ